MKLAYRDLGGEGPPVVFLHGMFGSSQNWTGMARRLAPLGRMYALDLRNHGDSPHAATHTLDDCVADVHEWTQEHAAGSARLIGHSMGGLVAMGCALMHPEAVVGIASIDIAPRFYPPDHERELRALSTDIGACRSRAAVDALLAPNVPDSSLRQFLLTNAVRDGDGFRWRLNVEALRSGNVSAGFAELAGRSNGDALLVACGRSTYVRAEDHAVMRGFFPRAEVVVIPEADHWPHVSAPARLEEILARFLDRGGRMQ